MKETMERKFDWAFYDDDQWVITMTDNYFDYTENNTNEYEEEDYQWINNRQLTINYQII